MSAIDDALIAAVTGGSPALPVSGLFQDDAPEAVVLPYLLYSIVTAPDEPQMGGRAWEEPHYLVKVVASTKAAAASVAAQIDALLEGASLVIGGYDCMAVDRIERIGYVERDGGRSYYHAGGIYRVMACLGDGGSP